MLVIPALKRPMSHVHYLSHFNAVENNPNENLIPTVTATESRVKRQNDDEPDISPEELCKGRPGDEYFRLTTEGDCRDVVR